MAVPGATRRVTARQLNRATLDRQLLLRRVAIAIPDGVRRVMALQAQEPASPYLALWSRIAGFDASGLDAAFTRREVVKATLMRMTLHAVHADDYGPFQAAMAASLRASRVNDPRFAAAGGVPADVDRVLPALLEFAAEPRTKAEIEAWLDATVGGGEQLWWALRAFAPLHHAPSRGRWTFGPRAAYVAAASPPADSGEEAVAILTRRYLEAFGPASAHDLAQFTRLPRATTRAGLRALGGDVVELEGPHGPLYDLAGAELPDEDVAPPPRLLAMWDSVLLAYADRSRVIPPAYRPLIIRSNGDVLPTLLVDGAVAGVWRAVPDGIEASAFHRLPDDVWARLETESRNLLAFLADREPLVYRRYGRWWDRLPPPAEIRVIGR